jgi:hypothetical protein
VLTTDTVMNIDPGTEILIDYGPVFFPEQKNAEAT